MLRVYLTGRIAVESDGRVLDERQFPGRQARLAFVYLCCQRGRPVTREELADVIWPDALPAAWDTALSALVSRLRSLLAGLGLPGNRSIESAFGCYQLRLPLDAWVDIEAALEAIDQAESAVRAGDPRRAWASAEVAVIAARRPFLPGDSGPWVERQRAALHDLLVRAVDCLADIWLATGEPALAIQAASEAVALEPFRETGYQRLMRVHAAVGNRAEALRVYESCRALLAEELGADPSAQTEQLYLALLRSSDAAARG